MKLKTSPCGGGVPGKGCGKPMVWITTPEGSRVPLDPSAPVYLLTGYDPKKGYAGMRNPAVWAQDGVESGPAVMVSHFKTCSAANQFSKGRK